MNKYKLQIVLAAILVIMPTLSSHAVELKGKAKKLHAQVLQRTPLYDDPELAEYVDRIGQKVLSNSPHADREYHFFVLDAPGVNAFTPGHGLVYMNRGMLVLMRSEGQLAGVLGHEIGHNTGRHLARSKNKRILGNIVANAASIVVGNRGVGDAIGLSNEARLSSFGRELELEADKFGAEYMYKSNYAPSEMLGMLGILKDQSDYQSKKSGSPGYHGVFVTHPRSDKRLQQVIRQAGELPPGEEILGRDEYRDVLEGVVYGPNIRDNAPKGWDRYINKTLGITFLHPETWDLSINGAKIVLKDAEKTAQLKITIEKTADKTVSTEDALKAKYPDDLSKVEKFQPNSQRDLGSFAKHTSQRVALAKVARNTFNFQGIARNNKLTDEQDQIMVNMIRSFRRLTPQDKAIESVLRVEYKRWEPGDSFAGLAASLGKEISEIDLRLINGYYPKGQPEPGTWTKLLKRGE